MEYVSTRGDSRKLGFREVIFAGLAPDNGLYVPTSLPHFDKDELEAMRLLPYPQLVNKIIKDFINNDISDSDLMAIINASYHDFDHQLTAPLVKLNDHNYILELFHGPTFAFKDFALQLLGNLFDHFLKSTKERLTILGATSGDTGSAAIHGCKKCKNVDIFILHPYQKVSEVQRLQMTTVMGDNIRNVAVMSDFDFCQSVVKKLLNDEEISKAKGKLIAVNSINWGRIMAQIVYYFSAYLQLDENKEEVIFSVPTGNFGDIFAGYLAKKMGLPIAKLIIACNQNDILHRFINSNDYRRQEMHQTLAPSMDIQVSSNFERLLYFENNQNSDIVRQLMDKFEQTGTLSVDFQTHKNICELFASCAVSDEEICQTIKSIFDQYNMVIDPHTATAVFAAEKFGGTHKIISLATAHPAKFTKALDKSGIKLDKVPAAISQLGQKQEEYFVIEADINRIREFILAN